METKEMTNRTENREVILSVEHDWGEEEFFLNHTENGDFISNSNNDFIINGCPSNVDDIDEELVFDAVQCHYATSATYGQLVMGYENLEKQIEDVYKSVY